MAKEQRQEAVSAPAPDDAPEALGPPKSYRLYTTLGFVALILFQMITLWLLLPPRVVPQIPVGLRGGDLPNGIDDVSIVPLNPIQREEMVEKPLKDGAFRLYRPRGEMNEDVSITLVALVRKKDEKKFQTQYERRVNQISSEVMMILGGCGDVEYGEVSYTTIRERVKIAVNKVLETPWVQEVIVTEFERKVT